jgi:hypothetical protein
VTRLTPFSDSIKDFFQWINFFSIESSASKQDQTDYDNEPEEKFRESIFGLREVILMDQPTYRRIDESQLTLHLQWLLTSQDNESKDQWSHFQATSISCTPDFPAFWSVTVDRWESMRLSCVFHVSCIRPSYFSQTFSVYNVSSCLMSVSDENFHAVQGCTLMRTPQLIAGIQACTFTSMRWCGIRTIVFHVSFGGSCNRKFWSISPKYFGGARGWWGAILEWKFSGYLGHFQMNWGF